MTMLSLSVTMLLASTMAQVYDIAITTTKDQSRAAQVLPGGVCAHFTYWWGPCPFYMLVGSVPTLHVGGVCAYFICWWGLCPLYMLVGSLHVGGVCAHFTCWRGPCPLHTCQVTR